MTSKTTVLAVVFFVGLITLVALGGTIFLIDQGVDGGQISVVSGTTLAGLGILGTLLASTRSTLSGRDVEPSMVAGMVRVSDAASAAPQDVNVVNAPSDPVPVDPRPPVEGLADPPERAR